MSDILIPFIGGLAMFIFGMNYMAQGLQNAAGNKMRSILEALTQNKIMGVALGAIVTAIVQSSSATTVMVVGFVNAALLDLSQAMTVIMGANIGTTITGWVASSSDWAAFLSPTKMAPLAIMAGVLMQMMGKRAKSKEVAMIIIGFGLLFVGMSTMSSAVSPLRESELFKEAFITMGQNPFLGIVAGAAVTAIIQSSSAAQGILLSLAAAGLVPYNAAIYIIMGQNIGTCITALLSGIGAGKNAKCVGTMHLLFNLIGTAIFTAVALVFFYQINPAKGATIITQTEISAVHTIFNIGTTLILFPFSNAIIRCAMKVNGISGEPTDTQATAEDQLLHLDERMVSTPGLALEKVKLEVVRLGGLAYENVNLSLNSVDQKNQKMIQEVSENEDNINSWCKELTQYLIQLSHMQISGIEHKEIISLLGTISDMERISDHAENISELAEHMIENKLQFSADAKAELVEMSKSVLKGLTCAVKSLGENDLEEANKMQSYEDEVDAWEKKLRIGHIDRMSKGLCNTDLGMVYFELLVNLERISDHAMNIAEAVIDEQTTVSA
ncbi:MAG: Na/Pi cotransporter family protein [Bacillota bacterium]